MQVRNHERPWTAIERPMIGDAETQVCRWGLHDDLVRRSLDLIDGVGKPQLDSEFDSQFADDFFAYWKFVLEQHVCEEARAQPHVAMRRARRSCRGRPSRQVAEDVFVGGYPWASASGSVRLRSRSSRSNATCLRSASRARSLRVLAAAINSTVVAGENPTVGSTVWLPAESVAPGR